MFFSKSSVSCGIILESIRWHQNCERQHASNLLRRLQHIYRRARLCSYFIKLFSQSSGTTDRSKNKEDTEESDLDNSDSNLKLLDYIYSNKGSDTDTNATDYKATHKGERVTCTIVNEGTIVITASKGRRQHSHIRKEATETNIIMKEMQRLYLLCMRKTQLPSIKTDRPGKVTCYIQPKQHTAVTFNQCAGAH